MKNTSLKKNPVKEILLLCSILFLFQYCTFKEEKVENKQANEVTTKIYFTLLARLNETNIKIIKITTLILNQTETKFSNHLILKIEKDYFNIESQLNRLKEENLIVTQKPISSLNLNKEVVKNGTNGKYTLQLIETLILNEISILQEIEKTFTNDDFTKFACKAVPILIENQV